MPIIVWAAIIWPQIVPIEFFEVKISFLSLYLLLKMLNKLSTVIWCHVLGANPYETHCLALTQKFESIKCSNCC